MKILITIFSSLLLLLCSCKKEEPQNWGPRLDAIEKALSIKDAQIAGLSELAYIQALDTAALQNDSFNLASITFAAFQIPQPASCRSNCGKQLSRDLTICQHVAPQNYIWCIQKAIRNYTTCIGRCH